MALLQRPYRDDDEPSLLDVWRRARWNAQPWLEARLGHRRSDDRAFFRRELRPLGGLHVAEERARVVAFLQLLPDPAEPRCGVIERLYVAPESQRRGIGAALLSLAKERHPAGLTLHTHRRNRRARRFYERHGFEVIAAGTSAPPESEADLRYAWSPGAEAR